MDWLSQFVATVRQQRAARGLSVQALAALAGMSRQTLHRIEGGTLHPRIETAARLAAALGLRIQDLVPPWQQTENGTTTAPKQENDQ